MYKNPVVIPALNPPERFIPYVMDLIEQGFERILVVDDGSAERSKHIFDSLEKLEEVTVFRHAINLGKGRALKNAFNYALVHWGSDMRGVITADSDGQHTVEDVIKLHNELEMQTATALVLGTRNFCEGNIPFKSRYGNQITSLVFRLLYGVKVDDTQTGLRAIPTAYLRQYCDLPGERFEYEMNMLIYGAVHKHQMKPCLIRTIYFDNNSETHFRPVLDSLKIYRVIFSGFFAYILSSASAAVIDLLLFHLFTLAFGGLGASLKISLATVFARILSSIYNFAINRGAVFKSKGKPLCQAAKYYTLCVLQMAASAGLVIGLNALFHGSELLEKVIVDSVLFLFSYQIQRAWVFREVPS